MSNAIRHGGRIVVEHLIAEGVERVFTVPGESFLAILDGLYDSPIRNIVCRHEGAAAMMAEATGKLTGRPGVAIVTRGPGATNASAGVHVARQDSTPMVLLIGQIARDHRDREAFQEVDYRAMFAPLAKWVAEVDATDRLPEYLSRAFHTARSGRPGPVVLALPEDVLSAATEAPALPPTAPAFPEVSVETAVALRARLMAAKRPMILVGGSGWSQDAARELQAFAEAHRVPVAASFRRQDYLHNDSQAYAGDMGVGANPALVARFKASDTVLALGARITDIATGGFEDMDPASPGKSILHVHPDAGEIGKVFRADMAVVAPAPAVATALAALEASQQADGTWQSGARDDYEAWQTPAETPGELKLETVVRHLAETLPHDAILTNGAGNYAAFLHRYYRFRRYGTQVAPTSGSMGYGLPAAIAAKKAHPNRPVICFAGDGCFQMTGNEMATALQEGANVVILVCDNGRYGTIRMHQERHYPGRVSGTDVGNPDFAALARAHGGIGLTVDHNDQFPEALSQALSAQAPALIHLKLDPRMLATGSSLP